MKKQKTKLGARILSKEELNAILPNAESVYEQIAVFRNSVSQESGRHRKGWFETEQKTNNIGIMGCRGAGKTSILKTFYHKLKNDQEEKKDADIILPIIIPENMSYGTTLMDAVLGRLKSIVEERKEEEGKDNYLGDCIYSGRDSLEQQYNELVKQYCYIKKDYRDILIQEFTTEQNYVDKTKKVFSSDSEFIRMFHQFVVRLLRNGEKADGKITGESPMMFLFIDDVDLSANRCMDIVRTLLVYLSNPRIVTFISGDMQTFEEELTLEFIRQEGALREDVFRETYYAVNDTSGQSTLLERKKTLAYEYLKKIIPPAYRRTIRYWPLEERGNYRIIGNDGSVPKSLAELLVEVSEEKLKERYFLYKEDDEQKCMGLAFHMFDDTSRGLNNVYNVLQEICEVREEKKDISEDEKTLLFWRFIETMADAKPLYTKYKSVLMKQVIVLGQGRVKIDFANAYQLLYAEPSKEKEEKGVNGLSARERFSIYSLIDFAARLFPQEGHEDKKQDLKNRMIQEYLSDETIDDKIASKRELIEYLVNKEAKKAFQDDSVRSVLVTFLRECDFILVLHLIRCLGRENIYDMLTDNKKYISEKEIACKIAYALSRAIQAINDSEESIQDYLAGLYLQMRDTMLKLLNNLSLNPRVIYGRQLIDQVTIFGMLFMNNANDLAYAAFENIESYVSDNKMDLLSIEYLNRKLVYWIYYEKELRERHENRVEFDIKHKAEETVSAGLTKTIMNQMLEKKVIDQYVVRALKEVGYDRISEGKGKKDKQEIQVIEQIDRLELWKSAYVQNKVDLFLNKKRKDYVSKMSCGRAIFDATQLQAGAYAELKNCYKGSSGKALIIGLESKVRGVMFLPVAEQAGLKDGKYYLCLEQVLIIQCLLEEFLQIHWRVQYGKKEARKLLMEVKELPLVIHASERDKADEQLHRMEEAFFTQNPYLLRDSQAIELEQSEEGKKQIAELCGRWYDSSAKEGEWGLIRAFVGETGVKNEMYFRYLIQKMQIEMRKESLDEEKRKAETDWSCIEPDILEDDYIFFFHSYLRCLQANDTEAKNAGAQAEDIAKLAQYMLDGEVKADEKIQNEVYQIISREIELTEEEFEELF